MDRRTFLVAVPAATLAMRAMGGEAAAWQETARRTHARFTGKPGTFAQFGDSITVTKAFWTPLQYTRRNASPAMEEAFQRVKAAMRPECWGDWKGPEYGSEGGQTAAWALQHLDEWLKRLNPEAAVILFGTNDLNGTEPDVYQTRLRELCQKCGANGTVVILTTIPPRHGVEKKAAEFAQRGRDLTAELKLPLIDYHAEVLKRRPDDWDGALERFSQYRDYEVPTLISRDGVHPSYPKQYQDDYSEAGLRSSGYTLRSYLTLLKYAEVLKALG